MTGEGIERTAAAAPLLAVRDVSKVFRSRGREHTALEGVSFGVAPGRTLAVVGESGAGKTTLARLLVGLERPTSGTVALDGAAPEPRAGRAAAAQMVFQSPVGALNPYLSVASSIAEPVRHLPAAERAAEVRARLTEVGLDPDRAGDRPRSFSGGQLQRVVIARALAARPRVLVCDEPTSALDVSVSAQIINLLLRLQERERFAMVLVTHDLGVVRVLADDVLVLRHGRMVELTPAAAFFTEPAAEYSRSLLEATFGGGLTEAAEETA